MHTSWLRSGVVGMFFAVACSDDADNPFADASFTAGDHGDASSASASSSSDSTGAETTGGETTDASSTSTGIATSDDDGSTSEQDSGAALETGSDDESSTTAGTAVCIELGECQPCVDCTVQPGGECQDEALACQGDGDCNALAACYNACAMMFMGDELEACVDTCYDDYPDAVTSFEAAYGCFIDACGDLCPTEFGPLGD